MTKKRKSGKKRVVSTSKDSKQASKSAPQPITPPGSSMDKNQARRLLAEAQKRAERKLRLSAEEILFGPQLEFVKSKAKNKAAVCSRRAGKSFALAFMLLTEGLKHERAILPYITLTRSNGKEILWPALADIDREHGIGLTFRENTGDVVLPNKSKIILRGADDRRQIEKLRGPKYPIAVIDEAQAFPHYLHDLINEVLEPATLDYSGSIVVTGTPNSVCAGPFFDITTKPDTFKGWDIHKWTLMQNPHLPDKEAFLKRIKQARGLTDEHPAFMREYLGLWVRDAQGRVYALNEDINRAEEAPFGTIGDWEWVLGIDLGYNDPTAFVVVAASATLGQCFVVDSYQETEMLPASVMAEVDRLMETYPLDVVVCDSGGFGKGYTELLKEKYGSIVQAAKKTEKLAYIEHFNGDLRTGSLKVLPGNEDLLYEMSMLQWDMTKLDRGVQVEDKRRYPNHYCDALLYAWRECRHQDLDYRRDAPGHGTPEWYEEYERELEDKIAANLQNQASLPWWEKLA